MKEKRIALFPGSFDPFTKGHLNTVERAAKMFDQLIIGIVTNTTKSPMFSEREKLQLTKEATAHLDNVSVIAQKAGLTVDLAKELDVGFLVRGLRSLTDYEYERSIAFMNREMAPEIETVFLLADEKYSGVSSTIVKEIARFEGDVSDFLPPSINQALIKKMEQKNK